MNTLNEHNKTCDCVVCYSKYLQRMVKENRYDEYPLYDVHAWCKNEHGVKCLMLRDDYTHHEKLAIDTCPCHCHNQLLLGVESTTPTDRGQDDNKDCVQNTEVVSQRQDCVCTTRGLCECDSEGPGEAT